MEDDKGGMNRRTSAENEVAWTAPGVSLEPLRCCTTDAGKAVHARDAADHERRHDLGYAHDAEGRVSHSTLY